MDRRLVPYGGGYSRVEFCDVYAINKKMIHVRRYGGSSVLSHLFAQGLISGELFAFDGGFREKLNDELPDSHWLVDAVLRPNPQDTKSYVQSLANRPVGLIFLSLARQI